VFGSRRDRLEARTAAADANADAASTVGVRGPQFRGGRARGEQLAVAPLALAPVLRDLGVVAPAQRRQLVGPLTRRPRVLERRFLQGALPRDLRVAQPQRLRDRALGVALFYFDGLGDCAHRQSGKRKILGCKTQVHRRVGCKGSVTYLDDL